MRDWLVAVAGWHSIVADLQLPHSNPLMYAGLMALLRGHAEKWHYQYYFSGDRTSPDRTSNPVSNVGGAIGEGGGKRGRWVARGAPGGNGGRRGARGVLGGGSYRVSSPSLLPSAAADCGGN